ncbi:MAG TPA: non-heme iron oxygenase ferredoxin subunit [Caulifigura sp.]|jgi:3-phenylpropionate/trans-cinnamate dioxygenase ferredoxin subunit|nr:non-heme iron oxygenase ferredoxin subunit [Caulifigura sp.]
MSDWVRVAGVDEVAAGGRLSVEIDDTLALLLRDGERYYCIEDLCTHDGQPLTNGEYANGCITCPRHGAKFDVATGEPKCMPATEPVRTFPVEARPDGIYVSAH